MNEPPLYHDTCHHRIYYLTCDEFDLLWGRSGGRCEICGINETDTKAGRLYIDHNQAAGHLVRGLLCDKCNAVMRRVDEGRPEYMTAATRRFVAKPFYAWFRRPIVPLKATRAWRAKSELKETA